MFLTNGADPVRQFNGLDFGFISVDDFEEVSPDVRQGVLMDCGFLIVIDYPIGRLKKFKDWRPAPLWALSYCLTKSI